MAITLSTPVKFNPRDAYHIREKIEDSLNRPGFAESHT